jgi:hypothetical protein
MNQDEILAQFQGITQSDNIEQCQRILETSGWDLQVWKMPPNPISSHAQIYLL